MPVTVDQFFYSALRYANLIKRPQTSPSADETEECRQVYNSMVDAWRADGLTISHISRNLFNLIPNQADYSVGPGGDFDIEWPERIERAGLVISTEGQNFISANVPPSFSGIGPPPHDIEPDGDKDDNFAQPVGPPVQTAPLQANLPEYPLYPLTVDEWQLWVLKNQITNWPRFFFYERSWPLGIMHMLYVPTDANQVALYLEEHLIRIDATGDALLDWPPGYQEALEANLAIRLAMRSPGLSNISPEVKVMASAGKTLIANSNNRPLKRVLDWTQSSFRSNVYLGNRYLR